MCLQSLCLKIAHSVALRMHTLSGEEAAINDGAAAQHSSQKLTLDEVKALMPVRTQTSQTLHAASDFRQGGRSSQCRRRFVHGQLNECMPLSMTACCSFVSFHFPCALFCCLSRCSTTSSCDRMRRASLFNYTITQPTFQRKSQAALAMRGDCAARRRG